MFKGRNKFFWVFWTITISVAIIGGNISRTIGTDAPLHNIWPTKLDFVIFLKTYAVQIIMTVLFLSSTLGMIGAYNNISDGKRRSFFSPFLLWLQVIGGEALCLIGYMYISYM